MKDKILITTAIDYTNDVIHIGHAYQKVLADAIARFYRLNGKKVFFLTGTDEHGANIERIALEKGRPVKDYVDFVSEEDKKQIGALNVAFDRFIRTTDEDHKKVVAEFWQKVFAKGDIYSKHFEGLYCLSCEAFKSGDEIVNGRCAIHQTKELAQQKEENYFFKWSNYQKFLEKFFEQNPRFVLPENRYNEMRNFLKEGLEDISISRQSIKWGIAVPDSLEQVIYVWFDALINYYTGAIQASFWDDKTTIIHIIGKDNLRWHALLWPAMLEAAGLKQPDIVYAHGFINIDGQKVSKTLGNIIRPTELVEEFGADAVRYFLLKRGPLYDDVDISKAKIKEVYNADLANGIGNLAARVAKICETAGFENAAGTELKFSGDVAESFENFAVDKAVENILERITAENQFIDREKLWKKSGEELKKDLTRCVGNILQIAFDLQPFMPTAALEILKRFSGKVVCGEALFKRIL